MDELEKTAQETAAEEQTGDTTAPDAGEDFETLIRGRYKGEFDARVRKILDGRLRGLRQENERLRQEAVRTELLRQREYLQPHQGSAGDGKGIPAYSLWW